MNFLAIRMVAAVMVIYSHSYALSGLAGNKGELFQQVVGLDGGRIAVSIFFTASGFLVTASFARRCNLFGYLSSRVLRIYPALIVCLLLSALVLGPIYTTLDLGAYFDSPMIRSYVWENVKFDRPVFRLPGVFEDNPFKNAVNGSLWTLPAEARMYIFVGVFGLLGLLKSRVVFNAGLLSVVVLWLIFPSYIPLVSDSPKYFSLAAFFAAGAYFYANRDFIPLNGYVLMVLVFVACLFHGTPKFVMAFGAVLAYGTLWVAYLPSVPYLDRIGDYSYGLYIYAFPVQQALIASIPGMGPLALFAYAVPLTLVFAVPSWHLVEKPFLSLKRSPFLTSLSSKALWKRPSAAAAEG